MKKMEKYKGKKIKIYSFALGGYKQPQQLFALAYILSLGYHLDVVINIDGFNEVALSYAENYKSGVSTYYPRNWSLYSQQYFDKNTVALINTIEELKLQKQFISRFPPILSYLPTRIIDHFINQKQLNLQEKIQLSEKPDNTKGPEPYMMKSEKAITQNIIDVWKNSSLQMARLSQANNIDYYEFLQPNQYLPGSKEFTQEEKNKFIKKNHIYSLPTKNLYPKLIESAKELAKKETINIVDLTQVFKSEKETIYEDDCCHYNKRGNSILTKYISQYLDENE
jgi:hypothetical protein